MTNRPDVSVVLPCHNAAATVALQLEALARQSSAVTFEVVVVDNRSADDLAGVVGSWARRAPRVRLVQAHDQAGAGYARNVGVACSRGDKLLFCDADDLVARDWVTAGAKALDEVELACGADVTLADREFDSVDRLWTTYLDKMPRGAVERRTQPVGYPILLGGNLAIRRNTYLELHGYDVSMRNGNEDNDLAVRAERSGHLVSRAPAMCLAIRERADLRSFYRRARIAGRGHMQLLDRHDLREVSPYLRGNAWRLDVVRSAAAGLSMLHKPAAQREWPAVATRLGAAVGMWEGDVMVRRGRGGRPMVGVGLERREDRR